MAGQYRGQCRCPRQQPLLVVRQYSTDDVLAHGHSAVKRGVFCSRMAAPIGSHSVCAVA
jgi:hypothetical protein